MTMIVMPTMLNENHARGSRSRSTALKSWTKLPSKRESVVITKRGQAGRQARPSSSKEKDDIFGFMKGKITILGDIVSPILTPEEWGDLY